jgi:subtilase family serine protease
VRLECEELESRTVLSAASFHAHPGVFLAQPAVFNGSPIPGSYTPAQIQQAYGFNTIPLPAGQSYNSLGSGETIAIVDAYNDPNILSDANVFSSQFGLPQFNSGRGSPTFTQVNENGSARHLPTTNVQWAGEISLDVEWAHAIAPSANIVLVESSSFHPSDLTKAINTARSWSGVVAVSMSWGGSESSGISSYDQYLTSPAGHPETFVAATLDNGAYYHGNTAAYWPAVSPNVLAVGGTTLNLDANGNVLSETGWAGSGGGLSKYESQPAFQRGFVTQSSTKRGNPDVAYNADFNTGFAIYDTVTYNGQSGWFDAGGTSAGTPQWAALVTIADQERAAAGLPALDGPSQTLYALYDMATQASGTYFNDITSGNNGYAAGPGYDLVTGLGTPKAKPIVAALASVNGSGGNLTFTHQ